MSSYRLLIVYDVDGWAYHHNASAIKKHAPSDFEVVISSSYESLLQEQDFDIVLFLPFTHADRIRRTCSKLERPPLVVSVFSVGWDYANDWLDEACRHSDGVIITSYRMWDMAGRLPDTWYCPSGVDFDIFMPNNPIATRQSKVLWCGSLFHRKIKGYDDILLPLQETLNRDGIELDLRLIDSTSESKYSLQEMAEWYNTGAVYICSSLAEGTPNTVLEAAACGCTIVSTPVGNMSELIKQGFNGYLVKWNVEDFYRHILAALKEQSKLTQNMQTTIQDWSWSKGAEGYYNVCREMLQGDQ